MLLKKRFGRPMSVGLPIFFIIILFIICAYGHGLILVVQPENSAQTLCWPAAVGDTWQISFTHSVEKTAWDEFYRIDGNNHLTLTHTEFSSYGWGYPYSAKDGKFSTTPEGKFRVEMNRSITDLKLRISVQAMQKIIHHKNTYDLCQLFGDGCLLNISVQKRYQWWLNKLNFRKET